MEKGKAKYAVGDKVKFNWHPGVEYTIVMVRKNVYDPSIWMYHLGCEGESPESAPVYNEDNLDTYATVTKAVASEPKLFEAGTSVWVDNGRGTGRRGTVLGGNVSKMPNGDWVQYSVKFPGGQDNRGYYEGHTDYFVNGENVYKYSPLERLARIEKILGIED